MTLLRLAIVAFLLLLAVPAHARTAGQLLAWCLAGDTGDYTAGFRCLAYIEGAMDAEISANRKFQLTPNCHIGDVTMAEEKAIVQGYILRDERRRTYVAASVVVAAMNEAFHCSVW
jgi:hypothetical protein